MKRTLVCALVLLILSSLAGRPAMAQRERAAPRARAVSPDTTDESAAPRAPARLDHRARLRFLEDLVATATSPEQRAGIEKLQSWISSSPAALVRPPDVRLTPRTPYSDAPWEAYLRTTDGNVSAGSFPTRPGGYIYTPTYLFVRLGQPPSSTLELYLVDFTITVPIDALYSYVHNTTVFRLHSNTFNSTQATCLINFKDVDEWRIGYGEHHLLAVMQTDGPCELYLHQRKKPGIDDPEYRNYADYWYFYSVEIIRLD